MESASELRVLVCDDHVMLAEGLTALLRAAEGIDVVGSAGSVAEVLEMAAMTTPDVIVLDYDLPDGTGVEALEELRRCAPDARVVMLTAFADDPILVRAIEAGCAGFLTKQKATADLVDAVRLVAAGEAVIPPDMLARLLPRFRRGDVSSPVALTPREQEVLELLATGATSAGMARDLEVSPNTIRNHVQAILVKLGAHSRLEAVAIAVREGLVSRRRG